MMNDNLDGNPKKAGGLRKIGGIKPPCLGREHMPPMHIVLEPGQYEYICPDCGHRTVFTVPYVSMAWTKNFEYEGKNATNFLYENLIG